MILENALIRANKEKLPKISMNLKLDGWLKTSLDEISKENNISTTLLINSLLKEALCLFNDSDIKREIILIDKEIDTFLTFDEQAPVLSMYGFDNILDDNKLTQLGLDRLYELVTRKKFLISNFNLKMDS